MNYIELLFLALSLCLDTFTVSLAGGICEEKKIPAGKILKIIFFFAFFQTAFLSIGWFLGNEVVDYIAKAAPWIAFILLMYVGIKMIVDAVRKKEEKHSGVSIVSTGRLTMLSIATSIDAFAVGISIAMLPFTWQKTVFEITSVFVFTALASLVGLLSGKCLGRGMRKSPMIVGGIILILIGIKILLEHYF